MHRLRDFGKPLTTFEALRGDAQVAASQALTKVAIGLIQHRKRIVVGRRGTDGPLAGYDEFPGGKCLPDELPTDGVVRECREETGLSVRPTSLRKMVTHHYEHGSLLIHFFECAPIDANPVELRWPFRWVELGQLGELRFPAANAEVVAELIAECTR